ncbi:MAG: hypothetical protein KAH10_00335 [Flavobacteriales bacterium]|nr:hypothetical protein [Flavobacteriales bacterium]
MKKLLLFALIAFASNGLFAQATPQLNMGFGLNSGGDFPIYASYDFPVHEDISVAPMVQLDLGFNWITLGARGDYYFDNLIDLPTIWDVYGGANVGYNLFFNDSNKDNEFDFGLQIGGRWHWSDKWALNLEFAGGTSFGTKIGVTAAI